MAVTVYGASKSLLSLSPARMCKRRVGLEGVFRYPWCVSDGGMIYRPLCFPGNEQCPYSLGFLSRVGELEAGRRSKENGWW